MADSRTTPEPAVAALFSKGRLVAIPRKAALRDRLLAHLARTLFTADRQYRESEVNDALKGVHEDFPALRRFLVEAGYLERPRDGSTYRLAG